MLHLEIVVEGRVQGVCFRAYTQKKALQWGINGTVRNLSNANVEIQATGDENNMQEFLQCCHKGPLLAKVTAVTHTVMQSRPEYTSFIIID